MHIKPVLIWKYWSSNKRTAEALFKVQVEVAGDV